MTTQKETVTEQERAAMLDVQAVAALLTCSSRHVYRLCDARRMPAPIKLGALRRWNRLAIEEWLAQGCPSVRGR